MDRTEILLDHIKAHVENDRKLLAAYSELLQVAVDYVEAHPLNKCNCDIDYRCWSCKFEAALQIVDAAMPLAVGA